MRRVKRLAAECVIFWCGALCGGSLCGNSALRAEMRVASLNPDKKYGAEMLAEIGKQPDLREADILLLQEVVDGPRAHVAAEIARTLGMTLLFAPAFRLNGDFEEGPAILSRIRSLGRACRG